MPNKISKNLVSPTKALVQKLHDTEVQRGARQKYGEPEDVPGDVRAFAGPRPTLFNATTGEWEEVMPNEARLRGAPIGPPNPDIINKMFRGGYGGELPLYGSDIMRT